MENHFTFSISPNKPNHQEMRFIFAKKSLLTFFIYYVTSYAVRFT